MLARYRKKPVVIEAMFWPGGPEAASPIIDWAAAVGGPAIRWDEAHDAWEDPGGKGARRRAPERISIDTLEGTMYASPGDWIIRGVKGEFYPCKPDIFEATYDKV